MKDLSKEGSVKPAVRETDRGFQVIQFLDRSEGLCSLQQSSATDFEYADRPGYSAIWIGREFSRAHLDREQVKWIIEYLQKWIETGSFTG